VEAAFRDAVRRIEFPGSSVETPPAARSEESEIPAQASEEAEAPEPAEPRREAVEPRKPGEGREPIDHPREGADRRRDTGDLPRDFAEPWREAAERWREPVAGRRREAMEARRDAPDTLHEPPPRRQGPIEPTHRQESPDPPPRRPEPVERAREPGETRRESFETRRGRSEARREPTWDTATERPHSRRDPDREPPDSSERRPPREPRRPRDLDGETERRESASRRPDAPRRGTPPSAEPETEDEAQPNVRPRSLWRRLFFFTRILLAVAMVGALAYAYATSEIDLSWLSASPSAASPQRAALYDASGQGKDRGLPVVGKAAWRTATQTSSGSDKPETVVMVDAQIPESSLAMTMTIERDTEPGAGMSHMIEITFAQPDRLPFGGISAVPKIVMKATETDLGDDLVGTSIAVGPGNYLFGLLGTPDLIARNTQFLRTRPWLGVLINFADGPPQMLTVEKGASGQKAIEDALAKWGQ
jgi:hypothetical protein